MHLRVWFVEENPFDQTLRFGLGREKDMTVVVGGDRKSADPDIAIVSMKRLAEVRSANPTLPLIVLVPEKRTEELVQAMGEYGADEYLDRPITREELGARIRAILRRYHNLVASGEDGAPVPPTWLGG